MIKLGSGLLVAGGVAHIGITLGETAARHAGAWFGRELWGTADLADLSAANGAFWISVGSWAVPQTLLGLTLLWLDRRGVTPPSFIAWGLGGYALALGLYTPQATAFGAVVVALLLLGARRARANGEPRARSRAGQVIGPADAPRPGGVVRPTKWFFAPPTGGQPGQHAEVAGQPAAAGMGEALPGAEQQVHTGVQRAKHVQQSGHLPEREQARHVRERGPAGPDALLQRRARARVDDHDRGGEAVRERGRAAPASR